VLELIEVSSNSDVEEFLEFEPVVKVELVMEIVGPNEVDFKDPEADKLRMKSRLEGHNNDINDTSGDSEIIDLTEDTVDDEEDLCVREYPYLFISDSERDSDSD
jgi:hypothetical protein